MASIFTKTNEHTEKPNRNTFDLSYTNNLTLKLGTLTPFTAIECIPGDSYRIDPSIGFDFQPLVHPVQTNLRADVHFFYVPNRALWDGWKNFIGDIDSPDESAKMKIPPYINWQNQRNVGVTSLKTGGIADYLGLPTEVFVSSSSSTFPAVFSFGPIYEFMEGNNVISVLPQSNYFLNRLWERIKTTNTLTDLQRKNLFQGAFRYDSNFLEYESILLSGRANDVTVIFAKKLSANATAVASFGIYNEILDYNGLAIEDTSSAEGGDIPEQRYFVCILGTQSGTVYSYMYYSYEDNRTQLLGQYGQQSYVIDGQSRVGLAVPSESALVDGDTLDSLMYVAIPFAGYSELYQEKAFTNASANMRAWQLLDASYGVDASDLPLSSLPYRNAENPDGIPISALPYRAYEAIYNSFYRDDRNNPRKVNGQPVYNNFLPTKDGGADTTYYHLYQRNWEADFLTTAVQSPQQGVAPLVGVTSSGVMTFQDENGTQYTLQATVGEDGETLTGISSYSSDMPVGTLRAMVDTISTGISINDFRNVNACQRWLEKNMRKGLRYKDQIEAHFGVSPTYSELDLPIFIGGFSRDIDTTAVSQTSQDTSTSALGTKAGQAHVVGSSKAPITHFCEEHGWIIGIISIVPKPVYSQLLNKSLFKSNVLDYFTPEFGHIGPQPILNQEVAPLLCQDVDGKRLTDVFGYQRAWYEYLERTDEAHGDFRGSMRRYLINRLFTGLPQLGNQFLTISQDEANDVFASTDPNLSKIFGQVHMDISAKRPIPLYGIPRLEV